MEQAAWGFFSIGHIIIAKKSCWIREPLTPVFRKRENKTSPEIKINVLRTDVMMKEDKFLKKLWCCVGGVI